MRWIMNLLVKSGLSWHFIVKLLQTMKDDWDEKFSTNWGFRFSLMLPLKYMAKNWL